MANGPSGVHEMYKKASLYIVSMILNLYHI